MEKIKRYKVIKKIHEDILSDIYRCQNGEKNNTVLIKKLKFNDEINISKFKKEFKYSQKIHSLVKNSLKPLQLLEDDKDLFFTIHDPGGDSLSNILSEKRIDIYTFLNLSLNIIDIITELHVQNIIHQNITPANFIWNATKNSLKTIMFYPDNIIKRQNLEDIDELTLKKYIAYISPEQTGRINRSIDYRSDFYSLGILFYEMISGRLPFQNKNALEIIHWHIAQKQAPVHRISNSFMSSLSSYEKVPKVLSDIIDKLLEKSPDKRYQNIYALRYDFQKCLDLYLEHNDIPNFKIGLKDKSSQLNISHKIYNRETELDILYQAFNKAAAGSSQIAAVSGFSGVGKSALIDKMKKNLSKKNNFFVQGKFDRYQKFLPYGAFIQAFRELVRFIIKESESNFKKWEYKIKQGINNNGQLLINIIPELEKIIGQQPDLKEINPKAAKNRFSFTLINFIKVICEEYMLTIFLDDVQWCDPASCKLMELIANEKELRNFLLIIAYRNNEVPKGHVSTITIDGIKKVKKIFELKIKPLPHNIINLITSETLKCKPHNCLKLSELIYKKTGGNPFFTRQLLKHLFINKLITYNIKTSKWKWDLKEIKKTYISDNVVEVIISRLKQLSHQTQNFLQIASCLENTFSFNTLALIYEQSPRIIIEQLNEAINEEIIIPLNENYLALKNWEFNTDKVLPKFEAIFKFTHDRIQQAAYSLIDPKSKKLIHLQIGHLMLKYLKPTKIEENIIEIIRHFNEGRSLIKDPEQKIKLLKLNLMASIKTKKASAYFPAYNYITIAKNLLPKNYWTANYKLTFKIYKTYLECALLCGKIKAAQTASQIILKKCKTNIDKALIMEIEASHFTYLGKMDKAINCAIKGLAYLKIKISKNSGKISILKNLIHLKKDLNKKSIYRLLGNQEIKAFHIKLAMKLFINLIPPAFISGNHNLFACAVLKGTRLSLKNGNCPESSAAFIGYAVLLASLGDYENSYSLGKTAIELIHRYDTPQLKSMVYVLYTLFCHFWNNPPETMEKWFKKAINAGFESGELLYTSHACFYISLWDTHIDISTAINEIEKNIILIEKTNYKETLQTALLLKQYLLNLQGKLNNRLNFNNSNFNETKYIKFLTKTKYFSGIAIYYTYKIHLMYLYEEYEKSIPLIYKLKKIRHTLAGSAFMNDLILYSFLNLTAIYKSIKVPKKIKFWKLIKKEFNLFRKIYTNCPLNFTHIFNLMEGELARIKNKPAKACEYYDLALKTAEKNDLPVYKALISEIIAKFYFELNQKKIGELYIKDTYFYYLKTGAFNKVKQLEKKYTNLIKSDISDYLKLSLTPLSTSTYKTDSNTVIDSLTLIKAMQTISKQLILPDLLKSMMTIIMENLGAQHGFIILKDNNKWKIAVEGNIEKKLVKLYKSRYIPGSPTLFPSSVFYYTTRLKKTLVIDNAIVDDNFNEDPYIKKNNPKSILCSPIIKHNKIIGLWYLENNLISGLFNRRRLQILNILSTQMTISLENAQIYQELEKLNTNLENTVSERTKKLRAKMREIKEVNKSLHELLSKVETLEGLIPICSHCKKIRDDRGYWNQIEKYISEHSRAEFTHGICPDCAKKHYPDLFNEEEEEKK